jgi:alpha-1,2-mannosyltransferase
VSFAKLGYQRDQGLVAATVALGALCLGLEPVLWNMTWGQVNLVLMVLVVADLALPDSSRWKGIGVGVAAAVKLVPGIFVVYLILTKRFRAAATSIASFAVTVGLGFLVLPHESKVFWTGSIADADRITGAGEAASPENQTVRGQLARIFHSPDISTIHWLPAAVVFGLLAMAVAVLASRQGRELLAISVVGATGVLVSPLAWSHYWVWFVPFAVMGVSAAWTQRSRWGWLAVAGGYLLLFAWPVGENWALPFPGLMFVMGRYPAGIGLLLQSIQVVVAVLLLALAAVDVLRDKPAERSFLA